MPRASYNQKWFHYFIVFKLCTVGILLFALVIKNKKNVTGHSVREVENIITFQLKIDEMTEVFSCRLYMYFTNKLVKIRSNLRDIIQLSIFIK